MFRLHFLAGIGMVLNMISPNQFVVALSLRESSKAMVIEDAFLSEKQTADFIGTKISTLRNWSALRKGPPRIKVGRKAMYRREALVTWLQSRERDYEAPQPGRGRGRPKKKVT